MKTHLSSEAMDLALAGMPTPETSAHLRECEPCQVEFASMRELLSGIRMEAVKVAAFHLRQPATLRPLPGLPGARPPARWAMAFAAAVLMLGGAVSPLLFRHHAAPAPTIATRTASPTDTASDDALLSSVQNDLSTSVPAPLLPLASTSTLDASTSLSR